jgi:arylsulfate sulfotransferase
MPIPTRALRNVITLLGICLPAFATVQITAMAPSRKPPQLIGTPIVWTVKATDSNPGPLTFRFSVALPKGALTVVRDFNVGALASGTWTAPRFVWVPSSLEGAYKIQVVIKDFSSGETATKTVKYAIAPLVTGSTPVTARTTNPLVALFSAPSCPAGSAMRVSFQPQSMARPATLTNYVACHPPNTMTFEIAGMYPSTTYNMFAQTNTGGTITNGPTVTFTTGPLPTNIPFPTFNLLVPPSSKTDRAEGLLLFNPIQFGNGPLYANVVVDFAGNVVWYYYASPPQSNLITRPLSNSTMLSVESGAAWDPANSKLQYLRQIDLTGNIVRETNIGVIQQQLLAMGAADGGPCSAFSRPAPVGAGCVDGFHHDAIQTLPNGFTAVLVNVEKIFPAGTQGDTSGLPVDIVGDMILVLDTNWQLVWYFDSFDHANGAPQLDINRPAVLGETCSPGAGPGGGCPPMLLMGSGIAPLGKDWLHGNSLYYWPQTSDLVLSTRNQDWVMKIDYNNGAGTGNILWRMGPCGDFTFNNIYNDSWPWFSAQHDVGIENSGAGPWTFFDNSATRVSPPSGPGSSTGCMPGLGSGNSRGMVLTVDENTMQANPVLSVDLGSFSTADGSAQLLSNGNYFFLPAVVLVNLNTESSYAIEIQPTAGTDTGTQVLNQQGTSSYRAFRMPDLYHPPTT